MDRQKISLKQFLSLYVLYAKMDFAWLLRDRVFASLANPVGRDIQSLLDRGHISAGMENLEGSAE